MSSEAAEQILSWQTGEPPNRQLLPDLSTDLSRPLASDGERLRIERATTYASFEGIESLQDTIGVKDKTNKLIERKGIQYSMCMSIMC